MTSNVQVRVDILVLWHFGDHIYVIPFTLRNHRIDHGVMDRRLPAMNLVIFGRLRQIQHGVGHIIILKVQYIPRNMHTVFALLCFVAVIRWLIFPYPPGLLHWHCGNLTIAPVPAKQPWWIWISTSCEISMNNYITTTKQSTTKPCAYFLGYTVSMSRAYYTIWQYICICLRWHLRARAPRSIHVYIYES